MKATDNFTEIIRKHLEQRAYRFPLFKKAFENPDKNIDDCVTYILNTVKSSGQNGFSDDEVFGMAAHYYDEENIEVGSKIQGQVVVNRTIELSKDEIAEAKQKALDEVVAKEKERLIKKPKKTKVESVADNPAMQNLFEL